MNFDYIKEYGIVQQKKKYATFTITEIGGPLERQEWFREQAKQEALWIAKREEQKLAAKKIIAPDDCPEGTVTWTGHANVTQESWESKQAWAKIKQEDYFKPTLLRKEHSHLESAFHPFSDNSSNQPLFKRITSFISKVWHNANFSN